MYTIKHDDAIELESQLRRLYKCDRGGVSGLVDADNFESCPLDAAVLVISYIYARGLETSSIEYDEFLHNYRQVFTYPEECDIEEGTKNYINDLKEIIDKYL